MSTVDVFDVTVSQLEEFANVAYEDLSDLDCLDKYMVVTTWSWFGQQPRSMMVACDPVADKEQALGYANGLDTEDLMANRMGISSMGNHYEVWHVVEDPTTTHSMDDLEGEGASLPVYQRYELEAYLGEFVDEYDVDAIEHEVTKYDPIRGCLVWTVFGDDLSDVCARHEYPAESVDDIEPEPVDWFGEMGDTLDELDEGLLQCRQAYEYVRALDEIF